MSDPIAQALAAPIAQPPVNLDAQGCVGEDLNCRKCGYNLRGLSPDGRCPECGTPVGRSLLGDYLRFAEPHWVRTLALGARIVTIALVLDIILAVILGGAMTRLSIPPLLPTLLNYSIALVALVGYWKATEPDPGDIEDSSRLTERRLVRITMVAAIALSFVSSFARTGRTPIVSVLLPIAAGIVGVVKLIALFSYARQMALRIPDHKMAKQCKVIMTGLLIMLAIGFVGGATMRTSRAAGGVGPAVCVIGLVSLILVLASIRLLLRFRKAFQQAARFAAANWAAEPPGA